MLIESHLEVLRESTRKIQEAVQQGLTLNQRTLGFHSSAAAIDMLEIIFHQKNLIDPGFVIKHEWFNSPKRIKEKFPFDFPQKEEILSLMCDIETARNKLCYGKKQTEEMLEEVVNLFNQLTKIFLEVTKLEL